MSNYVKSTNFTAKDSLPSGDANKVIRGSEFDKFKNKWTERCHLFWELMAQEDESLNRPPEMAFPNYAATERELVAA